MNVNIGVFGVHFGNVGVRTGAGDADFGGVGINTGAANVNIASADVRCGGADMRTGSGGVNFASIETCAAIADARIGGRDSFGFDKNGARFRLHGNPQGEKLQPGYGSEVRIHAKEKCKSDGSA